MNEPRNRLPTDAISIIGMACRYPGARSPAELWENVLAKRRAFRTMPAERWRAADYFSPDPAAEDRTYSTQAAVIEDYSFDRVAFRIAESTYRAADLAHWLALDVAAQALTDAGFPSAAGIPRETTRVIVGNSLTGEFSRAAALRLRWPYVRRMLEEALAAEGALVREDLASLLVRLEERYKAPFPPVGAETLAGGLSNTIAGRICNHFDLKGGGYTVDGACSSSLLAVASACSALLAHEVDVALVGGVDLSLDPFELVGFAKTGALAKDDMRVYDARSAGFWPGEGCGFVVLARRADAAAWGRRPYALIRGWGVSSDGCGGLTRPEVEGQTLALRRAYAQAGFGIETVALFEGHGTGTAVGDDTELQALSAERRRQPAPGPAAAIGSIKANIGHTKAASGVAGLLKAALALHHQLLPPCTGAEVPHPALLPTPLGQPALRLLSEGQPWPAEQPQRAGVSAMGFGGINVHVALEGVAPQRSSELSREERRLLSSPQDAELFVLGAQDRVGMLDQVERLLLLAPRLSLAELADLAAALAACVEHREVRASLVAATPAQLVERLRTLNAWLADGIADRVDSQAGVFLGSGSRSPCITFLFPGQGSPVYLDGGAWSRRFAVVRELYQGLALPLDESGTALAQPAITASSLAALRVLEQIGLTGQAAIGHSLGELSALCWAESIAEAALLRIAAARGRAMAGCAGPEAAMASIAAGREEVGTLLHGLPVVIAALNTPRQTVVSGEAEAVRQCAERARVRGIESTLLPVSHAFHSPLVAGAAAVLTAHLADERLMPPRLTVVSTVSGAPLAPETDLRELLGHQVTAPVRFMEAAEHIGASTDLFLEVGPGQVLCGLIQQTSNTPAIALDAAGASLSGLLLAAAAAFSLGAAVDVRALFAERFTRPFDLNYRIKFFASPCESLRPPEQDAAAPLAPVAPAPTEVIPSWLTAAAPEGESLVELFSRLVAERSGLPRAVVRADSRLLADLHLNSLTVAQLIATTARALGLPAATAPTDYATASIKEVADAFTGLLQSGGTGAAPRVAQWPGVASWVRSFEVTLVERPRPRGAPPAEAGSWQVIGRPGTPFFDSLAAAFARSSTGHGIVVSVPADVGEGDLDLLLAGIKAALAAPRSARFVLVQHGGGAASLARTLHAELRGLTTCVVDVPPSPEAVPWVLAEAQAAAGYVEAHYDAAGVRREPVLRLCQPTGATELPLGAQDLLLVTGGGKGIAAESALHLGKESGVRLVLLGRAEPSEDAALAGNLRRFDAAGVRWRYVSADVTDRQQVASVLREIQTTEGPITAVLHGAGTNEPRLLRNLDEKSFHATLAVKVQGARNVLDAIEKAALRLFITFGSVIARTGMPGEGDYALANEWLTRLTERFQAEHPACRCQAIEWSVWSGVGMGERLGRVDALEQQGITPISPDQGVVVLLDLLRWSAPPPSVIVTGRFGEVPVLKLDQPELPLWRFLEQPRVYYHGVELVSDVKLSAESDPYLRDHQFRGACILPAVMGLEAMAQVAMALVSSPSPPSFAAVRFTRPVTIADGGTVIRVAALARGPEVVEVVLRTEETGFQVDHFSATCHFAARDTSVEGLHVELPLQSVPLQPERDLYGRLLFQGPRFQRILRYCKLTPRGCVAELTAEPETSWFGPYQPRDLLFGDPGARDAAMQAIQACVPYAALLPVGIERLTLASASASASAPASGRRVRARERTREGDMFIYDLEILGPSGCVEEKWEGLKLQLIQGALFRGPWAPPLLVVNMERRIQELCGTAVTIAMDVEQTGASRSSERIIQQALQTAAPIYRRPDGKPEAAGGIAVSATHLGALTIGLACQETAACDAELVAPHPASAWQDVLGEERYRLACTLAAETGEDMAASATRVWVAAECLKKVGAPARAPLTLASTTQDGWVLMTGNGLRVMTWIAEIEPLNAPAALAVVVRTGDAHL